MSTTLAGNPTIPGSVANLIVVEKSKREVPIISFCKYCRVGVLVTLSTLLLGIGWLSFAQDCDAWLEFGN
jgi:Na+/H+ antiporter NhaD/arsenite permease-like protein